MNKKVVAVALVLGTMAGVSHGALQADVADAIESLGVVVLEIVAAIAVLAVSVIAAGYGLMGVRVAARWVKGLFAASR